MSTHATPSTFRAFLAGAFLIGTGLFATACGPKYPACEEDADCKAGEFCVNQLCQKCRTNEDCGVGQQCNGGACEDIPGFCDDAHPCGAGEACVGNRCEPAQTNNTPPPAAVDPGPCQLETVYFAFDSSTLEPSARDAIAKNAECIRKRELGGVKVTGYTDPRGTEEYNLALGDRRAQSVQQYMGSLGVDQKKLGTASMGEEMARGEDEGGWAKDRRVEFQQK
jgi:peptidoglycan-associated lipoprotein